MSPYDFLSFPMTSQDAPGLHRISESLQKALYKSGNSTKFIGNPGAFQGLNSASVPGRFPERVRRRPPPGTCTATGSAVGFERAQAARSLVLRTWARRLADALCVLTVAS